MIYHGNRQVKALYLGDTRIVGLYKGDEMILSSECTISVDAPHTTLTEGTVVNYGSPYTATIAPDTGYGLKSVTVTMDGVPIQAYSDGVISIPRVTGDVMITAVALQCTISVDAPHTTLTEGTTVPWGGSYTANIAAESGYALINVVVTMDGEVISAYSDGVISIPRVTGDVTIEVIASAPIVFQDANVKSLCVSNWGGNYIANEITEWEAAQVTSIGTVFKGKTNIVYFNEFEYFTGIRSLYNAFNGCSALKQIKIPHTTYVGSSISGFSLYCTFKGCSALQSLDMSPMKENTHIATIYDTFYGCSALTTLTLFTTSNITASSSLNMCFRGIGCTELDLSPWAGSHLSLPSYCFWGFTNMERIITTGVYINGANDSVSMGGSKVTEIIGGFMGWNKNMTLTSYGSLTHESAVDIIDGLATVTSKTITFSSSTYNRLSSDETAIAIQKGWTGDGLWQKVVLNGVNMPFGMSTVNAADDNGINFTSNMSATIYKDGVDTSATDIVNGFIRFSNNAENAVTLTTNSNSGTINFSGTATVTLKNDSRFFFAASQNGWYKVTLNIDSNTTVLATSAKGTAVQIRRYTPYATRCTTSGSVDYDFWEFVNVESFVAGSTIEAYGYMGVGDVLMTLDALSGSATFSVELVSAISIPSGYAIACAMPLELRALSIPEGLSITHSIDTKFKLNRFNNSDLFVGSYGGSTNRSYCIGRNNSTSAYQLYTYWGKASSNPTASTLVNSSMLNNALQFTANSTHYTVKRYNNGTKYTDTYGAATKNENTNNSFSINRCNCFWLRLWKNGTMVKELVPIVDTETRTDYALYDLVDEEAYRLPVLLGGAKGGGNDDEPDVIFSKEEIEAWEKALKEEQEMLDKEKESEKPKEENKK